MTANKTPGPTVHLIGNAHIDPVWLWRWQEGFAEIKTTFAGLRQAWKHLLFNQFHDTLAGSSVQQAYVDAQHQLGGAIHAGQFEANAARQAISWHIDTRGEGAPLVLFNNQPFPFSGVVETEDVGFLVQDPGKGEPGLTDAAGAPLPCQAVEPQTICGRRRFVARVEIPPLGYTVVRQGVHEVDMLEN